VPEWGPLGSVRGALSNERPYRDLRNVDANYPFESSPGFLKFFLDLGIRMVRGRNPYDRRTAIVGTGEWESA
jgi:hypothetical protein